MRSLTSLLLICVFTASTFGWGNAGRFTSASKPKFAMHDWIALEGYKMAKRMLTSIG